jgi:hypothetical protein
MKHRFEKVDYKSLNARQKEQFNFQKVSAVLADYGFRTIALGDDWQGADFIAHHIDGVEFLKVQLKGRLSFDKKYEGKDLWVCFRDVDKWYLYPHDDLLREVLADTNVGNKVDTDATDFEHGASIREADPVAAEERSPRQHVARQVPAKARPLYVRAELPDATANQGRFFDDDYTDALRAMATKVLDVQAPMRDDALAREVARAHGFARTGNKIKQRVLDLLPHVVATEDSAGCFLWSVETPPDSIPFRYHAGDIERRSLDEIAMPELIGLVHDCSDSVRGNDPALALAREIGLARLASIARERLEEALNACSGETQ